MFPTRDSRLRKKINRKYGKLTRPHRISAQPALPAASIARIFDLIPKIPRVLHITISLRFPREGSTNETMLGATVIDYRTAIGQIYYIEFDG